MEAPKERESDTCLSTSTTQGSVPLSLHACQWRDRQPPIKEGQGYGSYFRKPLLAFGKASTIPNSEAGSYFFSDDDFFDRGEETNLASKSSVSTAETPTSTAESKTSQKPQPLQQKVQLLQQKAYFHSRKTNPHIQQKDQLLPLIVINLYFSKDALYPPPLSISQILVSSLQQHKMNFHFYLLPSPAFLHFLYL